MPIKVWRFEDAPRAYQDLSTNGGDEDWVVFVPEEYEKEDVYIPWLERIDACYEPQKHNVTGGVVYIGSHA